MNAPFDNPLSRLRQLKGAPISVFLACYWAHQVVSQRWCCEQTGYSDYAVTRALAYLTEHNYLAKVTGGWMIAKAIQIPLMAALPGGEEGAESLDPENRDYRDFENKNRVLRDSCDGSSSSSTINDLVPSYLPLPPLLHENRVLRDSLSNSHIQANRAACEAAGIRGSKVLTLAKLVHVTPEFIAAHVEQAKRDGVSLGAAIHRIQENWDVDVNIVRTSKNPFGHDHSCRCARCKDARNNVAFGTHCPDCWKELNSECRCAQSEE